MKKIMIIAGAVLLAVLVMMPFLAHAEAKIVDMGQWQHSSLTWTMYDNGTLAITGKGEFRYATYYPWGYYQKDIKKIVIGDGVTNVPSMAFAGMDYAETVELGNSVRSIDDGAFVGCVSLTSISFPSSLESIGNSAFAHCTALERVYFAENGKLNRICNNAFQNAGLVELTTPKSLRIIDGAAFIYCANLQTVTLTDGLVELGDNAFSFCPELKRFYIGTTVTKVGECVLAESNNLEYLERHCDALLGYTEEGAPNLRMLVLGRNVKTARYIKDCPKLETVILSDSIKTIGSTAFVNCPSLKQIRFPASLETIEMNAFSQTGLKKVYLPDSLKQLGDNAFSGCWDLTYVRVGPNVETISSGAFAGCSKLVHADVRNAKRIEARAFGGCTELTYVTWPNALEIVEDHAFAHCEKLQTVQFAPTLTEIGNSAFADCDLLSTIIFQGDFPSIEYFSGSFRNLTATVYYPANNPTFRPELMKDYDGTLTWVPLCDVHTPKKVTGQESDCVMAGLTDGVICSDCGFIIEPQSIIAPKDHNNEETISSPSCSQLGYTELVCKDCGLVYRTDFEPQSSHQLLNWEAVDEYTMSAKCEACDFVANRGIPGDYHYEKDPNYKNTYGSTTATTKPNPSTTIVPAQSTTQPTNQQTTQPATIPTTVPTVPSTTADGGGQQIDPLVEQDVKAIAIMLLAIAGISLVTMGILIYIKLTKKDEKE